MAAGVGRPAIEAEASRHDDTVLLIVDAERCVGVSGHNTSFV